jgi:vesicular inhibitory amino acid transporter
MFRLIPTIFLPLSLLSYTSILGILSTVLLIVVVFVDGVFKKETPGSFWEPAETTFGVVSTSKLGIAFGLFMAGVSLFIHNFFRELGLTELCTI